ncbi:MAG: ATP-grasp domain-containing protein [Gammaproteobacteria bacterium]|nr:ATP-grasp domain-containing protein [Gammaproteobacteria bacterium]
MRHGTARPPLLVVARSGRALAAAAAPRFEPWVIDLFADVDTRALAAHCWQTRALPDWRFAPAHLQALLGVVAGLATPLPVVIGSGFEDAPALLEWLAAGRRLLGSPPRVFARLARPVQLFAALAHRGVAVPRTIAGPPRSPRGWLIKRAAHSGGAHVRMAPGQRPGRGDYFQARIAGPGYSALCVAAGDRVAICGVARHIAPRGYRGFTYHGAVSVAGAPAWLDSVARSADAIAAELGLVGAFGFDFILRDGTTPVVVDINPRLTATLDVYTDRAAIFAAHVAACSDRLLAYSRPPSRRPRGHLVVYAARAWQVPRGFTWPSDTADRPGAGHRVGSGDPLVTLIAEGADEAAVEAELVARYDDLHRRTAAHGGAVLAPSLMLETVGGFHDVRTRTR